MCAVLTDESITVISTFQEEFKFLDETLCLHEVALEVPQEVLELSDYHEAEEPIQSTQAKYINSFLHNYQDADKNVNHRRGVLVITIILLLYLELVPEFEVENFQFGPFVVPCTHLVNVGGVIRVGHAKNLHRQSSNERH